MIPDNEHAWRQRYLQSLTFSGEEHDYWSLKTLANDYQIDLSHLPLQIVSPGGVEPLLLKGNETVSIALNHDLSPRQDVKIMLRIDNQRELDYFNAGGVLRYIANRFI